MAAYGQKVEVKTARKEAEVFLRQLLSGGPVRWVEVKDAADGNALSWATVRRAKKKLGVVATKDGMKEGWSWSLPNVLKSAEGDHLSDMSPFGEI